MKEIENLKHEVEILREMLRYQTYSTGDQVASVKVSINPKNPILGFVITAPTVLNEEAFGRYVSAQVMAGLEAFGFNTKIGKVDTSMCAKPESQT